MALTESRDTNFCSSDADGSLVQTENEYTYAIRGIYTGFTNYLSLGLLPVKDPSMIRPANVITRPSHEIWKIDNGPEAKEWFTKAFPRFDWDRYVDDEEWERFAKATGTSFPNCQYSPGLQISSPDGQSGVALVGDAAHAFPPDIGQGKSNTVDACRLRDKFLLAVAYLCISVECLSCLLRF